LSGKIDSLSGKCPTLVFQIKGTTVFTSGNTTFTHGACKDVDRGSMVTVTGQTQSGGIRADRVDIDEK